MIQSTSCQPTSTTTTTELPLPTSGSQVLNRSSSAGTLQAYHESRDRVNRFQKSFIDWSEKKQERLTRRQTSLSNKAVRLYRKLLGQNPEIARDFIRFLETQNGHFFADFAAQLKPMIGIESSHEADSSQTARRLGELAGKLQFCSVTYQVGSVIKGECLRTLPSSDPTSYDFAAAADTGQQKLCTDFIRDQLSYIGHCKKALWQMNQDEAIRNSTIYKMVLAELGAKLDSLIQGPFMDNGGEFDSNHLGEILAEWKYRENVYQHYSSFMAAVESNQLQPPQSELPARAQPPVLGGAASAQEMPTLITALDQNQEQEQNSAAVDYNEKMWQAVMELEEKGFEELVGLWKAQVAGANIELYYDILDQKYENNPKSDDAPIIMRMKTLLIS